MRKPVLPRIIFFLFIYFAFFVALVTIQFARRGGFTHRVGNFVVTGQYRLPGEDDSPGVPNEYFLDGNVNVFFGGMDFNIIKGNGDNSFIFIKEDGTKEEILPERMIISGDSVLFEFPGGTALVFSTQYAGGSLEMRITAAFQEDVDSIELPFKPLRRTGITNAGDGQFIFSSGGVNYSFGRSPIDLERRMLLLSSAGINYRVIPDRGAFSPDDFVLGEAQTAESFNEVLTRWRDQNFSLWNRTISDQNNEDLVVAYIGEALLRGSYRPAVATVPQTFLRGANRTHDSSVYLGGLDQAYRSLIARDREKLARLSRQINERSLEFLLERQVFEYLAVRGQHSIIDAGADLVRTIDPSILALDIAPGILEGFIDWKAFRPGLHNPFEHLVDQACFVILNSLRITADASRVFSFNGNTGDTEFNIRLGRALMIYAEDVQNSSWAGIGRSLIISALYLGDASGAVKEGLVISETGSIIESTAFSRLNSAGLYRILNPVNTHPRSVIVAESANNNIWTWTAAQIVSVSQQNDVLDIAVSFPPGETHYMIIRGIRPFARMQLYNIDYRTDPQFEIYDSSGWVYIPQEQCLIVKMRHRSTVENIRIFYRAEAPPAQPTVDVTDNVFTDGNEVEP